MPLKDQPIRTREDRFADYLAKGMSVPDIRRAMNLTNGQAQGIMSRLRASLGPQAC